MYFTVMVNGQITEYNTEDFPKESRDACEILLQMLSFYEEESEQDGIIIDALAKENNYLSLLIIPPEQRN